MKIKTFLKRFNYPVELLDNLSVAIIRGNNGNMYNITVVKGLPIAKKILFPDISGNNNQLSNPDNNKLPCIVFDGTSKEKLKK